MQSLYDILKSLHYEYGEELNWLVPYPGDFHLLMYFQKASVGYPLPAIQACSQFKRTHCLAWEAVYRAMILKVNPTMNFLNNQAIPTENFPLHFQN